MDNPPDREAAPGGMYKLSWKCFLDFGKVAASAQKCSALPLYRRALDLAERDCGRHSIEVARCLIELRDWYSDHGQYAESEQANRRLHRILRRLARGRRSIGDQYLE